MRNPAAKLTPTMLIMRALNWHTDMMCAELHKVHSLNNVHHKNVTTWPVKIHSLLTAVQRAGIAQSIQRLATGWTVRGSHPSGGWEFSHPSKPVLGPTQLHINGYWVFPGGKAAGPWRWPPTSSRAEVKERVELYLYSPSGVSWPVLGWTVPLPLLFTVVPATSSEILH